MAAPANSSSRSTTAAAATAGQEDEGAVNTTTMPPLPRAIKLVMAISSRWKSPSTITTSWTKTIGELGVDHPVLMWIMLVVLPSMFIAIAAASTYTMLCDDGVEELISRAGGFCFLAFPVLLCVYYAVLLAAEGHLGLVAPRTPYPAWEAFEKGMGHEWMGLIVFLISAVVLLLHQMLHQAWPLLVAWTCFVAALVASTVAYWLCLLRTYGGDGGGGNSSCGEAVIIDGLACLYTGLLYEFAVRFLVDPDAGIQQPDIDSSSLLV